LEARLRFGLLRDNRILTESHLATEFLGLAPGERIVDSKTKRWYRGVDSMQVVLWGALSRLKTADYIDLIVLAKEKGKGIAKTDLPHNAVAFGPCAKMFIGGRKINTGLVIGSGQVKSTAYKNAVRPFLGEYVGNAKILRTAAGQALKGKLMATMMKLDFRFYICIFESQADLNGKYYRLRDADFISFLIFHDLVKLSAVGYFR